MSCGEILVERMIRTICLAPLASIINGQLLGDDFGFQGTKSADQFAVYADDDFSLLCVIETSQHLAKGPFMSINQLCSGRIDGSRDFSDKAEFGYAMDLFLVCQVFAT